VAVDTWMMGLKVWFVFGRWLVDGSFEDLLKKKSQHSSLSVLRGDPFWLVAGR